MKVIFVTFLLIQVPKEAYYSDLVAIIIHNFFEDNLMGAIFFIFSYPKVDYITSISNL